MGESKVRLIVGAVLSGALLALYAFVLVEAIQFARAATGAKEPTDGAFWILHAIGGLVSALVAAQLAVVPEPGGTTKMRLFVLGGVEADKTATTIALVYLFVWLALGFAAVIFGLVRYENPVPELADFAKTWIGLALAAVYAYFGIKPAGK
jgi:hypothetical protein